MVMIWMFSWHHRNHQYIKLHMKCMLVIIIQNNEPCYQFPFKYLSSTPKNIFVSVILSHVHYYYKFPKLIFYIIHWAINLNLLNVPNSVKFTFSSLAIFFLTTSLFVIKKIWYIIQIIGYNINTIYSSTTNVWIIFVQYMYRINI